MELGVWCLVFRSATAQKLRYGVPSRVVVISFPLLFRDGFLFYQLPAPEVMRIRTQVGLFRTLVCPTVLCLSIAMGGSQTISPPNAAESTSVEKGGKPAEALLTPQQLQEQHQQLLKAVDLIRQDAQGQLQRYATTVDRIRKDTDASLKRFATTVDAKLDRLNRAVASERERDLQTLSNSNRFALTTASILIGLLLLEILFLAWLSMRAVNRLATRMSAWISEQSSFPSAAAVVRIDASHPLGGNLVEETSLRLQNAIERVEQRLLDLELTTSRFQTSLATSPAAGTSTSPFHANPPQTKPGKASGVSLAVGQGESLIFLPQESGIAPLRTYRHFLQKLRKRFQPARIAKGH